MVGIADYFLWHDREIVNRCDDSLRMVENEPLPYRRSRGCARPFTCAGTGTGGSGAGNGREMRTFCL